MNIFDQLENATLPSMDFKEYLDYLSDRCTPEISLILLEGRLALEHAKVGHNHLVPVPDLRFNRESAPDAAAIPGLIMISDGLVTHCARLSIPNDAREIMKISKDISIHMPSAAYSFALLHEYFHIQRKHNDSQIAIINKTGGIESSPDQMSPAKIDRALEYDADLSAAGMIYRITQSRHAKELDDLQIRSLSFFFIFWFFLHLPATHNATNHGTLPERMYFIYWKLGQLIADPRIPPEAESTQESLARTQILEELAIKLEELFSKDSPAHKPEMRNFLEGLSFEDNRKRTLSAAYSWDSIRDTVGQISKSVT